MFTASHQCKVGVIFGKCIKFLIKIQFVTVMNFRSFKFSKFVIEEEACTGLYEIIPYE